MPARLGSEAKTVGLPVRGLLAPTPTLFTDSRYAPSLQNVRLFAGEVLNRPGLSDFPDPRQDLGDPINGAMLHRLADRAFHTIGLTENLIAHFDTGTQQWVSTLSGASPSVSFTGTENDIWAHTSIFDHAVFSNGLDGLYHWKDPSSDVGGGVGKLFRISTIHSCRYMVPFANRLVIAHLLDSGSVVSDRVRWSASGDHTVWDPATNLSAGFFDSVNWPGEITGMHPLGRANFIFKSNRIIRMVETGLRTPSFYFPDAAEGVGTLSGRSIVPILGSLFFLGEDNVYRYSGSGSPERIGDNIRSQLFAELNTEEVRKVFAYRHPAYPEYWLHIPTGTNTWPDVAYVYNYLEGSWVRNILQASTYAPFKETEPSPVIDSVSDIIDTVQTFIDSGLSGADVIKPLLGRSDNSFYLLDDNVVTDLGEAVTTEFITADFEIGVRQFNTMIHDGTLKSVYLYLRNRGPASIDLAVSHDGGGTWSTTPTETLDATTSAGAVTLRFWNWTTGTHVRLRIRTTDPIALLGFSADDIQRGEAR